MDGDIIIAVVTGAILVCTFVVGGGVGFGKIIQKQNTHDARIDGINKKVDIGFKAVNEKVDAGFEKNGSEHQTISRDIGTGNERISRMEGRMNGAHPPK